MFQNIVDVEKEENSVEENINNDNKKDNIKKLLQKLFTKQYIITYIIAFMLSMVSSINGMAPFGLAIFAAAISNAVPAGVIFILTLIGTGIGFGTSGILTYILTSLVFAASVLIFKPWYEEEYKSERRKLGKYVFIATLLVQVVQMLFRGFLLYDLFLSVMTAVVTYIFYKIFANSLIVISEYDIKTAFTVEEVVGASLMLSVATCAFGELSVFGMQIKTVLSILIVLVLGWKQGILIGATSGVTIGAVIGIIGNSEPSILAAFALSGMIAGALSRFGRIGVIIGFIAGNILLSYVTNGNTVSIIYLKEILVASLGLLLVPKNVQINIEDFFDKSLYLPVSSGLGIESNKDTIYKLNTVSETISEMSRTYKKDENKEYNLEDSKKTFIEEIEDKLEGMEDNILYDELSKEDNGLVAEIFDTLVEHENITKDDILHILENKNEYVLGFEDFDTNLKIEEDIKEIARLANDTYKIGKVNSIWKQKINDNKKVISSQLDGVSKVISSVANSINNNDTDYKDVEKEIKLLCNQKDIEILDINIKMQENGRNIINIYTNACKQDEQCHIEEIEKILSNVLKQNIVIQREVCAKEESQNLCKQIYISKDRFSIQIGIAHDKKKDSPVSGDYSAQTKLDDGKYLIALSDGMGSGAEARKSSQIAVKMLTRMLSSGFDRDTSMELINSSMYINSEEDSYATLDVAILDLYSGNMEFMKNGACPTFIKNKGTVNVVKSISLPAGILDKIDLVVYDKDLADGDIIVMCTDGILESNAEYENKEIWVKNLLEQIETDNVQKIANIILDEAKDNNLGMPKDDMTVIVAKVKKVS